MAPNAHTAASLRDQFLEEQQKIISYNELLERKVATLGSEVWRLCGTLKKHSWLEDKSDEYPGRYKYMSRLQLPEIEKLCGLIEPAKPKVQSALASAREQIVQTPQPPVLTPTAVRSAAGQWIEKFAEHFFEMGAGEFFAKQEADDFREDREQIEQINLK